MPGFSGRASYTWSYNRLANWNLIDHFIVCNYILIKLGNFVLIKFEVLDVEFHNFRSRG